MTRLGFLPTDETDLLWLLRFFEAMEREQTGEGKSKSYREGFEFIWRARFRHLHPDAIEEAVAAEWGRYKREENPHWPGFADWS